MKKKKRKRLAQRTNRKWLKIAAALVCVTILINVWGYGLTSFSALRDASEFVQDTAGFALRQMPTYSESRGDGGVFNQQKPNTTDGGGYRPIGTGCPNGKQQRPDGWCPPQQREGVDGHRENVGSWTNVFIPNGSIIPVDEHGNIRQIRCGEEGAFPCGAQ